LPSPIVVCGYAADTVDENKQHMDADAIREVSDNTFHYNLQTQGGTSGSPVFYVWTEEDEVQRASVMRSILVGVHISAYDEVVNQGCRLTEEKIRWIWSVAGNGTSGAQGLARSQGWNGGRYSARAFVNPAAVEIGGMLVEHVIGNDGDVTWDLEKLSAMKHVQDDRNNAGPGPIQDLTIRVDGPICALGGGLDRIYLHCQVNFQCDGRSVGTVLISPVDTSDALGAGLEVQAKIMDDMRVYRHSSGTTTFAALKIQFIYRFTNLIYDDLIEITNMTIYGNGDYALQYQW
jgi:hypothetical protein